MASPSKIPTFEEFKAQHENVSATVTSGNTVIPPPTPTPPPTQAVPTFEEFKLSQQQKPKEQSMLGTAGGFAANVEEGALRGLKSSLYGLGQMGRKYIPGLRWAGDRISDMIYGSHPSEQDIARGRDILNLKPENLPQKIGFGGEQVAEYFVPGGTVSKAAKAVNAGARLAQALPKLAKYSTLTEYMARGGLEVIPAVVTAKAQGQEDPRSVAAFAFAGPTFGKLLNMTGISKAATGTAKGVVGMVSKTIAEKIPEVQQSPRKMMWQALKPYVRNRDFDKALDNAMPEIYEQARMAGKTVENVDDFIALLKATKKRIWEPYEKFLGQTEATIKGDQIADAIAGSIAPRQVAKSISLRKVGDQTVEEIGGDVREVIDWANKYRGKTMSLEVAEDMLQNVNAEIKSFYSMYPAMQNAAIEAHPKIAGAVAEAEMLRKLIAQKIDLVGKVIERNGGTALDVKKIKAVYGGLLNLEQEAYRRVNVAKRLAPESLTEQMSKVRAAGEFAWGIARGHPLEAAAALAKGTAYKKAAQIIKERNTSDYLIKKAFTDFGEYVEQAKRAHRIPTAAAGVAGQQTP